MFVDKYKPKKKNMCHAFIKRRLKFFTEWKETDLVNTFLNTMQIRKSTKIFQRSRGRFRTTQHLRGVE